MSDLGLLCAKKDLAANDILYMVEEINDFKGGMAENYVNVQLSINGYRTYYWESLSLIHICAGRRGRAACIPRPAYRARGGKELFPRSRKRFRHCQGH